MTNSIIDTFYNAFQQKDYKTMQACYHPLARFTDEVFVNLDAIQVRAMWHMLLLSGKDMQMQYKDVKCEGQTGSANWIATYTFSLTRRQVVNDIMAEFEIRDGLIFRHRDNFNFYKWTRMAFGLQGILLGWLPFFRKKIQTVSMKKLDSFMNKY